MFLVTWLSNHESSTPCRLLPNYAGVDRKRGTQRRLRTVRPRRKKKMVVYEEQYKATMVDQKLDEAKVMEGEWHTKSKAPYHH